jgi:hypothetical protein
VVPGLRVYGGSPVGHLSEEKMEATDKAAERHEKARLRAKRHSNRRSTRRSPLFTPAENFARRSLRTAFSI